MVAKENLHVKESLSPELDIFRRQLLLKFTVDFLAGLPQLREISRNPILAAKDAAIKAAEEEAKLTPRKTGQPDVKFDVSQVYKNLSSILRFNVEDPNFEKSPEKCQKVARFLNRGLLETIHDLTRKRSSRTSRLTTSEQAAIKHLENARTSDNRKYSIGYIADAAREHFLSSHAKVGTTLMRNSAEIARPADDFDTDEPVRSEKRSASTVLKKKATDPRTEFDALKLLQENKSIFEVMSKTGLSYNQVAELRKSI